MSFQVRSSATAGNVTLNVYDETNAANLILSQAITLGSSTISATTNSNTTLSGISSSDINKIKVGETITGSGIPTGTTITAISISALTATISQAATASATVTLKNSDLPQKQSASFDVPNNCASLSYTISALAESGLPETYVDDVVITLTSAALTSTSVSIQTKSGQVVSTAYAEVSGTVALAGTIPFDNTVPQNTEGTQFLTVNYTPKRIGNKVRVFAQAYISEDTNTGGAVTMALFKDSDANAYAVVASGADDSNSGIDQGMLVLNKEFSVSSLNQLTFSLRGGCNTGPSTVGIFTREGGADANFGNTAITSIQVEEIQVGDYSEATTIPLTSAVFQTNPDSVLRLDTIPSGSTNGSTNTTVMRFLTIRENIGSDVIYSSSSTLGDSITIVNAGIYSISCGLNNATTTFCAITKNSTQLSTAVYSLNQSDVLAKGGANAAGSKPSLAWTGYLNAGDVIHGRSDRGDCTDQYLAIAKVNATKQINISSDQKIDLPSSELRMASFTGYGSTNTRVVRFVSTEKLVGDAFTVVNDPVLGFSLTIKKAGFIHLSTVLSANPASYMSISRNATQLSTEPYLMTAGQNLIGGYPSDTVPMAWSGKCNAGDVFRVHMVAGASAYVNGPSLGSSFNALFIEDKVQVSLSNVLPQFTQSDSSVRLDTANGYGSTASNKIRRFSNVRDNIGSDITYLDSATNGASFTISSAGTYHISFSDSANSGYIGISKNSSQLTTSIVSINTADRLAMETVTGSGETGSVSWNGYLLAGDVIRPHTDASGGGTADRSSFTISKVGKPNLTSVDVTPFTNYKGTDTESIRLTAGNGFGSPGVYCRRFSVTDVNTNKGVIQYTDSVTQGAYFTALKPCTATFVWSDMANGVNPTFIGFSVNSTQTATIINSVTDGYIVGGIPTFGAQNTDGPITTSATLKLNVGDIVRCHMGANQVKSSGVYNAQLKASLMITAVAEADQIVSPISSFSSDTASLVFQSTALTGNEAVGTFNTRYSTGSEFKSGTLATVAPTQSISDMNINGFRVYVAGYTGTSTAALPSAFDIVIGKGFNGYSLTGFLNSGKLNCVDIDKSLIASAYSLGIEKSYNPITGILTLEGKSPVGSSITGAFFSTYNGGSGTNGYIVVNASKSPTLAAVPQLQPRIAILSDVRASGTFGGAVATGSFITRTLNTVDDPTGVVSALASNQFTLPAGTFKITASAPTTGSDITKAKIRNITDSTDAIIGQSSMIQSVNTIEKATSLEGYVTITSSKVFELQQRFTTNAGATATGYPSSFGVNEVYSIVTIQKIK